MNTQYIILIIIIFIAIIFLKIITSKYNKITKIDIEINKINKLLEYNDLKDIILKNIDTNIKC